MNKILIVDDESINLRILSNCLKRQDGFDVLIARSGEDALKRVEYIKPEIILLDVMMPGIDGFEVCRHLKANENTRDIPIIFLTVFSETKDKIKGLELGAVDYITKPFDSDEVSVRVKTQLTIRDLQKQLEEKNFQLKREIIKYKRIEKVIQSQFDELEMRIMLLISDGLKNNTIAALTNRANGTIRNRVSRILKKIDGKRRDDIKKFVRRYDFPKKNKTS